MVALINMMCVTATALALLLGNINALGTNYVHDGMTTYCWAIRRPTKLTNLTEADRTPAFSTRAECPLTMTLTLTPADSVNAFYAVNVSWTVQADFSGTNAINNTRLYFGPDNNSPGNRAQIVHSNVHSCVFGTGCDPFSDGKELVDKTVNKIANFSDNQASFADKLQFPQPGEYSVLAHIILPNFNAASRFDYAVYTKLTVLEASAPTSTPIANIPSQTSATPTTNTSYSGLSQGATIAIVVCAIVVVVALAVVVVVLRRRRRDNHHNAGYVPTLTADDAGHAASKQAGGSDTNSTTGFQSAWGGQHRPAGQDTGVYDFNDSQYTAPKPLRGSETNHFALPHVGRPSEPPNARKKRIESDVEL